MRIYLHPALNKLFSAVVLLLSLGIVVFLGTKAVETWSNDPALNQIPQVLQKSK